MQLIKTNAYEATLFENQKIPKIVFDSYNLENLNVFALLFQTGYLTLTHLDTQAGFTEYTLNYPNFEVKQAFITYLLHSFAQYKLEEIQPAAKNLRYYLQAKNVADLARYQAQLGSVCTRSSASRTFLSLNWMTSQGISFAKPSLAGRHYQAKLGNELSLITS